MTCIERSVKRRTTCSLPGEECNHREEEKKRGRSKKTARGGAWKRQDDSNNTTGKETRTELRPPARRAPRQSSCEGREPGRISRWRTPKERAKKGTREDLPSEVGEEAEDGGNLRETESTDEDSSRDAVDEDYLTFIH